MQCSGTFSWRFCNQAPRRRRPQGAASVRRAHARSVASRRIQRDERFLATTRSSTDIAISSKSSSTRSSHSVASPRATRRPHATTWPSCISPVPTSDKLGARPARGGFGGMCVGAPRAVIAWAKTGFARLSPSWEGLGGEGWGPHPSPPITSEWMPAGAQVHHGRVRAAVDGRSRRSHPWREAASAERRFLRCCLFRQEY